MPWSSLQLQAQGFRGSVDPFHVKAMDTTGAGDSYVDAVLCNIVDDRTVLKDKARLREVLRFANACGAITTTESEVQSLLNGN
uniref:Carbohydrate kinase PfkB domain-containing protein n=1 Tax=Brassica oleracea TaxID=3712 RepID=A0A3P6GD50_BRAOL|nr:unnamed protein product [Brassica oleracea]